MVSTISARGLTRAVPAAPAASAGSLVGSWESSDGNDAATVYTKSGSRLYDLTRFRAGQQTR